MEMKAFCVDGTLNDIIIVYRAPAYKDSTASATSSTQAIALSKGERHYGLLILLGIFLKLYGNNLSKVSC